MNLNVSHRKYLEKTEKLDNAQKKFCITTHFTASNTLCRMSAALTARINMRDIPNNMGTGQDFEMMTKNMVRPNDSDIYVHLCISGKERGAESARGGKRMMTI